MDEAERYEWQSNGGCERCDALDGMWFEMPPPRPHPNCDCLIIDRSEANSSCDASDVQYTVEHSDNNHHGPEAPDAEFDMIFDYEIVCWGGAQTLTGEVVVSMTYVSWTGTRTSRTSSTKPTPRRWS